ncbi:MAG: efflux RND transporter periplasmic adaptor subunit [Kangiellaceae bacterium]|nr:efflux RND transporter periplasmic adaptor subunit [Kangiellaceae bacterium]
MSLSLNNSTFRMLTASALFIGALFIIFLVGGSQSVGTTSEDDDLYIIQTVSVQPVKYQSGYFYERNFVGQVEAKQSTKIGFEVGGQLKAVHFDEGKLVEAGDILAQLDTSRLNSRMNEAKANVLKAKSDAKLAESTYNRIHHAYQANAVTEKEDEEALEKRNMTSATVALAQAQRQSIAVDIKKSELISPFSGTIIQRIADEGTVLGVGQVVLEIQQNSDYNIRVGVTNEIVQNLAVGDHKKINIAGQLHDAIITAIIPFRNQARSIDVIFTLKQNSIVVRPGDMVKLSLSYEVNQRGFWVPFTAIKEGNRGLWSLYVATQNRGQLKADSRTVQMHYTKNDRVYVSGEVKDGERLIVEGAAKLVPEQAVRLVESSND